MNAEEPNAEEPNAEEQPEPLDPQWNAIAEDELRGAARADYGKQVIKAVVRCTLPEGSTQISASRCKLYLPTEDELANELQRER